MVMIIPPRDAEGAEMNHVALFIFREIDHATDAPLV